MYILASNVNKYKYQVSGGMTDAILGTTFDISKNGNIYHNFKLPYAKQYFGIFFNKKAIR